MTAEQKLTDLHGRTVPDSMVTPADRMKDELPRDEMQRMRDLAYTLYRRADGDLLGAVAILRAACLILCDLASGDPDPMGALDLSLRDMRCETEHLIELMQS